MGTDEQVRGRARDGSPQAVSYPRSTSMPTLIWEPWLHNQEKLSSYCGTFHQLWSDADPRWLQLTSSLSPS